MLITNVVNIYELNLGVFARPKERSRSYDWKGLNIKKGLYLLTRKVLDIMTIPSIIQIL